MTNFIVVVVILLIVGAAVAYIVKEKKKGVQCIGCPAASTCPSAHGGKCCSGCQSDMHTDE